MLSAFLAVSDRTRPSFFFCCDVSLMSRSLLRCSAQVFRSNNFFSTFAKDFLMTLSVSHWQLLRTFYNLSLLLLRPLKSSSSEKKKVSLVEVQMCVCITRGWRGTFYDPLGSVLFQMTLNLKRWKRRRRIKVYIYVTWLWIWFTRLARDWLIYDDTRTAWAAVAAVVWRPPSYYSNVVLMS